MRWATHEKNWISRKMHFLKNDRIYLFSSTSVKPRRNGGDGGGNGNCNDAILITFHEFFSLSLGKKNNTWNFPHAFLASFCATQQQPEANTQSQSKWIRRKPTEILNNGRDGTDDTKTSAHDKGERSSAPTESNPNVIRWGIPTTIGDYFNIAVPTPA